MLENVAQDKSRTLRRVEALSEDMGGGVEKKQRKKSRPGLGTRGMRPVRNGHGHKADRVRRSS